MKPSQGALLTLDFELRILEVAPEFSLEFRILYVSPDLY